MEAIGDQGDHREHNGLFCCSSRTQPSFQFPSHHLSTLIPPQSQHPRHRQQRHSHKPTRPTPQILLFIFLTCCCCLSLTSASIFPYISESMVETSGDPPSLEALAHLGTILVDHSPPPRPRPQDWTLATLADDLQRRSATGNEDSLRLGSQNAWSSASSPSSPLPALKRDSSSTLALKSTTDSLVAATTATAAPSPLPQIFDSGFNGNISNTCAAFMTAMLRNSTFQSCLPFSLLLQNSNSFFQASKSITRITQTLDATCAANVDKCDTLMASFAANITTAAACSSDIISQNPLITQAQIGLLAYKPVYAASCLRNSDTSAYCFADAVTNSSSPTDSYIYYLPLNISLPGGSQPTCNNCLRNTMGVFGAASSNRKSVLASDYVNAAMQVNVHCGPSFVNQSLAAPISSFGTPSMVPCLDVWVFALAIVFTSWLL